MICPNEFKEKLTKLRSELGDTQVLAVSKYSEVDDIQITYDQGVIHFGENRVQDLYDKSVKVADLGLKDICWHFIGNLQKNKINQLLKVSNLKYIHSIDSLSTLESLNKRMDKFEGEYLNFFFQVNTSGEEEKSGFISEEELLEAIAFETDPRLNLVGLMTMGSIRTSDFELAAKDSFSKLKSLRDSISLKLSLPLGLSMGMSSDYLLARDFGSNWVRIGSLLFK